MNKQQNDELAYIDEDDEKRSIKTAQRSKKLRIALRQCQKEKEEYLTQLQRARADLINFRQRQEKTIGHLGILERAAFIKELLPVLDSLTAGASANEGIKKIKGQFEAALKQCGVKVIKALGENFDPRLHEAVAQVKAAGKTGTVAEELQCGYMLDNIVIRPSRVKVVK